MTSPPVGKHILSELYACDQGAITQLNCEQLRVFVDQTIQNHKLTQLNAFYHRFVGGGITGLVALAESHIAIHTWPEYSYATIEVYICNHQRDNSALAEQVHTSLISIFAPERIETHRFAR